MPERKSFFVTGATGFLGSHLTHRLLQDGHHVFALARSSKNISARNRVLGALSEVGIHSFDNLEVCEGDIAQPDLGLDSAISELARKIDEVWHCAASLSFLPEDREEIFKMNVGGTRHLLDFVAQTPSRRLQHVSTAYVAGNRTTIALENEINIGQTFKNPYEESKCEAEMIVSEAHAKAKVVASVYRPSVVIGDSRTGRTTHFHGVYAFIRGLWTVLERMRRKSGSSDVINLPLRVTGSAEGTLNFVPIDYVVDGMIEISRQPSSIGGTYHLANPVATENRLWLSHVCRLLGVEGIQLVSQEAFAKEPMSRLEAIFQKQMAFYYQYLQGEPRFDCTRTLAALKNTGIECPRVNAEFIQRMVGWYVDYLNSKG